MIEERRAARGERARQGGDQAKSRDATLLDLGIPADRASRAMQLADVAALRANPPASKYERRPIVAPRCNCGFPAGRRSPLWRSCAVTLGTADDPLACDHRGALRCSPRMWVPIFARVFTRFADLTPSAVKDPRA
jgi:hypothetical protein